MANMKGIPDVVKKMGEEFGFNEGEPYFDTLYKSYANFYNSYCYALKYQNQADIEGAFEKTYKDAFNEAFLTMRPFEQNSLEERTLLKSFWLPYSIAEASPEIASNITKNIFGENRTEFFFDTYSGENNWNKMACQAFKSFFVSNLSDPEKLDDFISAHGADGLPLLIDMGGENAFITQTLKEDSFSDFRQVFTPKGITPAEKGTFTDVANIFFNTLKKEMPEGAEFCAHQPITESRKESTSFVIQDSLYKLAVDASLSSEDKKLIAKNMAKGLVEEGGVFSNSFRSFVHEALNLDNMIKAVRNINGMGYFSDEEKNACKNGDLWKVSEESLLAADFVTSSAMIDSVPDEIGISCFIDLMNGKNDEAFFVIKAAYDKNSEDINKEISQSIAQAIRFSDINSDVPLGVQVNNILEEHRAGIKLSGLSYAQEDKYIVASIEGIGNSPVSIELPKGLSAYIEQNIRNQITSSLEQKKEVFCDEYSRCWATGWMSPADYDAEHGIIRDLMCKDNTSYELSDYGLSVDSFGDLIDLRHCNIIDTQIEILDMEKNLDRFQAKSQPTLDDILNDAYSESQKERVTNTKERSSEEEIL